MSEQELLKKEFKINGKTVTAEEAELVSWNHTYSYMGVLLKWEELHCGVLHYRTWKKLEEDMDDWKKDYGDAIEGYSPTPDREIPDNRELYYEYDI